MQTDTHVIDFLHTSVIFGIGEPINTPDSSNLDNTLEYKLSYVYQDVLWRITFCFAYCVNVLVYWV